MPERYRTSRLCDTTQAAYVLDSYLDKLEAQVRSLTEQISATHAATPNGQDTQSVSHQATERLTGPDADVPNPLLDVHHGPPTDYTSSFAGEASCTAFGDRLLHCVDKTCVSVPCSIMPDHVSHPVFSRLTNPSFQLPNRVQASLLIRRVDRFIGNNYQLFLKRSFFDKFDRAYNSGEIPDLLWACHFFALLALGELYSSYSTPGDGETVPGTANFVQAIALLQDNYEHPSVEQIQILLLLVGSTYDTHQNATDSSSRSTPILLGASSLLMLTAVLPFD